jgi:uncharacterized protein
MRIVIPGGSGQVGHVLARHFHGQGHDVTVLTRTPAAEPWHTLLWDGATRGDWADALDGSDVCINLAGRSVNCRYHPANRAAILNSRVDSTRILGKVIASLAHPPAVWMNASTATIYRHALPNDPPNDELTGVLGGNEPGAPDTWNFSIAVARAWEAAFNQTTTPRTRKVGLRSAMTFSPDCGGVFDVFLSLVRRGLGGTVGSGRQFVSWIHDADFVRAVEFLIGDGPLSRDGAISAKPALADQINLASPNPLPNREFQRALREAWGTRVGLPTAEWMVEIGTWAMRTESELVLKSRRVVPTRLANAGFTFLHPTWPEAARDLVARWRADRLIETE